MLEEIHNPEDLKALDPARYPELAKEIRQFLIEKVSEHGGHLASNLGVVELTIALHLALDLPEDKIVWDVGHQSYTHKLLSGRREGFETLREFGGMSGFPKRRESEYDSFDTGHSSTSISAGLGLATARDQLGEHYTVVSVIGDGALSGGMAYEALNNASKLKSNFLIILNDNQMSISESTGGFSSYLSKIRLGSGYNNLKRDVRKSLSKVPGVGESLAANISQAKMALKQMMVPGMFFEDMDITYVGPLDGHDIHQMVRIFEEAKKIDRPVLIHVKTKKGKGYAPAEKYPSHFHGVSPFDIATGEAKAPKNGISWTEAFSHTLCREAKKDPSIVAVTAAMPEGTGLKKFGQSFPDRLYDVGIAEEHAVTFAAGMAAGGLKPVVAVYSSFLQRGFDQILHDVCIQNLPVIFALDRAGLVGSDGETHQGIFDLSYLSCIPNMSIMAPKNLWELRQELEFAVCHYDGPIAIRYPRGQAYRGLKEFDAPIEYGKGELLYEGSRIALLAVGSMVSTAEHVREKLKSAGFHCTLANGRFIKPVDYELADRLAQAHELMVILEENVLQGGYGLQVKAYVQEHYPHVQVLTIALPDAYVEHGNVSVLRQTLRIDSDSVIRTMRMAWGPLDKSMNAMETVANEEQKEEKA